MIRADWLGNLASRHEFTHFLSFKTHHLDVLLSLSGREQAIQQNHFAHGSIVSDWNPEDRSRAVGGVSAQDAQDFLASTIALLPLR